MAQNNTSKAKKVYPEGTIEKNFEQPVVHHYKVHVMPAAHVRQIFDNMNKVDHDAWKKLNVYGFNHDVAMPTGILSIEKTLKGYKAVFQSSTEGVLRVWYYPLYGWSVC